MNIIKRLLVWLKGLPIGLTGLVAFIGIMLLLTAIFNWFWTGLGTDPTRTFYAPFTNKFSDFKEYAALYIPLISFGATLFAGLVVFLVFNDWKVQHNKNVYSELATDYLKQFENIFYQMLTIDRHHQDCKIEITKLIFQTNITSSNEISKSKILEKELYDKLSKEFSGSLDHLLKDLNKLTQRLTVFTALSQDQSLLKNTMKMMEELIKIEKEITDMTIINVKMSAQEFMHKIEKYNNRIITITGCYMLIIIENLKSYIEA